jgi:hypothetical protein
LINAFEKASCEAKCVVICEQAICSWSKPSSFGSFGLSD